VIAPRNKLCGSTNFIIFGPMDQKLWRNKNLRKSVGRAGMCLTTCAEKCGHEEEGRCCKGAIVQKRWATAGRRPARALSPLLFLIFDFLNFDLFGFMRKFGDGLDILEEWVYNTPIF
jgi:hypothetical protein